MVENLQRYELIQENNKYIVTTGVTGDRVRVTCQDSQYSDAPKYSRDYSIDDLQRISRVFYICKSGIDCQTELNKAIEKEKVGVFEQGQTCDLMFYMMIGTDKEDISLPLDKEEVYVPPPRQPEPKPISPRASMQEKFPQSGSSIFRPEARCSCPVDDNRINQLENDTDELKNNHDLLKDEINKLLEEIRKLRDQVNDLQNEKQRLLDENKDLKAENEDLKNRLKKPVPAPQPAPQPKPIQSTRKQYIKGEIIQDKSELELITRKMNKFNKKITLNLLYKASVDSGMASAFHQKCDAAKSSVVLVETKQGRRFGGFTSQSWTGDCVEKKDDNAFLFSLDDMKTFDIITGEDAIGCYPKFGPIFLGCQIRVFDDALTKGGTTFEKGLNYNTTEDYELNGGSQEFGIKEVEVYGVVFS